MFLSQVRSNASYREQVGAFMESGRQVLIVVADMLVVTSSQLSFSKNCVDEMLKSRKGDAFSPIILFVVHFPPEWLHMDSRYDALFLNDWQYAYIDSLGITSDLASGGSQITMSSHCKSWIEVRQSCANLVRTQQDNSVGL